MGRDISVPAGLEPDKAPGQTCRMGDFLAAKNKFRIFFAAKNFYRPGRSGFFCKKSEQPENSRRRKMEVVYCTPGIRVITR
jgi:hypothetical protein